MNVEGFQETANKMTNYKAMRLFCIAPIPFLVFAAPTFSAQEIEFSTVTFSPASPKYMGWFGFAVSGGVDVNGDGVPDFLIGDSEATVGAIPDAGRVLLYSGSDRNLLLSIDHPFPQDDWQGGFGEGHAIIADIDQDEVPDILVGSDLQNVGVNTHQGQAYIFSGANGNLLRIIDIPYPEADSWFGYQVTKIGDVDLDGMSDYAVNSNDKLHIFSARSGDLIRTLENPNPDLTYNWGGFGECYADVGDTNGDGVSDLLVGARSNTLKNVMHCGQVYLVSGKDGSLIFSLQSPNPTVNGSFGFRLAAIGDVSGDGIPDLLVGAHAEDVYEFHYCGRAYVFSGADGRLLLSIIPPYLSDSVTTLGWSAAGLGDMNGDGIPDFILGSDGIDVGENQYQGQAYIFSGRNGRLITTLDTPHPEPHAGFADLLAGVGDLNGDGLQDILVAAGGQTVGGYEYAGQAHLFLTNARNTASGIDVVVQPVDPATGKSPVTVTFSTVTEGGRTTLNLSSGTPPPEGYRFGAPPRYFAIGTMAVHSGPITVCIDFSGIAHVKENALRLFRVDEGHWVDVTSSLDAGNDVICGEVLSLGTFALFEPLPYNSLGLPAEVVPDACGKAVVPVFLTNDREVDSLSFGIRHDPQVLEAVDFEASPVWTGSPPGFLFTNSVPGTESCGPGTGGIVVAMVGLPDDPQARTIPPGIDRVIGTIEYEQIEVAASAGCTLEFADCLNPSPGSPATPCTVSSRGTPVEISTKGSTVKLTSQVIPPCFIRGYCNGNGGLDISDPVFLLSYLFSGGDTPPCKDACDIQDDGVLDISDGIGMLGFLFLGQKPPATPFPGPGPDSTEDILDCAHADRP
jgi:hypothetical protein